MSAPAEPVNPVLVGRYALHGAIAQGGMATVHVGRLLGQAGFARTVAIKRLHPQFARDPEFVAMFMDEARLAARISHPNVVSIIDVVACDGELLLVMDYVQGEPLHALIGAEKDRGGSVKPSIAVRILSGVLHGLHAAHEARSERGEPLHIVHRDVSPQNVLVGVDGTSHVIDFGVAKAVGRIQTTDEGQVKGKLRYMAPEQLRHKSVDRRTDVYAAGAVLWETLTGERLFKGDDLAFVFDIMCGKFDPPSSIVPTVPTVLDDIVMRALAMDPEDRFPTAVHMAEAMEKAVPAASVREVAQWVGECAGEALGRRARRVAEVESRSDVHPFASEASSKSSVVTREPSQRTDVSAVTSPAAPSGSKAPWIVGGALAAAAVAAIGLLAWPRGSSPLPAEPASGGALPTATASASSAAAASSPAEAQVPPSVPAVDATSPPAASSASAQASATAAPAKRLAPVAPATAAPATTRKKRDHGF